MNAIERAILRSMKKVKASASGGGSVRSILELSITGAKHRGKPLIITESNLRAARRVYYEHYKNGGR